MLIKSKLDDPSYANIPGTVKYRLYPTTQLLRKSVISRKWDLSDVDSYSSQQNERAYSSMASDLLKSGASDSDHSELLIASDQGLQPIETEKLLKIYNEQGHYSISQAYDSLCIC
mmetsp:Transcript_7226/g.10108  ORF Transcript_7226/g.10108 Transcript_7226/m.10108 type:complete len:115 (-) Transcript_7226:447-791(-)